MKDKLGDNIMKEFEGLREKKFNYLTDNESEGKKAKDTKKCVIKRKLQFKDYNNCLKAIQLENKTNQIEKKSE